MTAAQALAQAIRAARMERGWTQSELAEHVGVSQGTISFWESGIETPTMEHVIALAVALPTVIESFDERERDLLQRVLRLERELFAGRCACKGCTCGTSTATSARAPLKKHKQETNMRIALSGKGGVGKTTIAGTLARILARQQRRVLALDSDSNPNMALSLGVTREQLALVPGIPHGITEWREDESGNAYVHLHKPVAQFIDDYGVSAPDGVQLMVMGEVLEASVGCRCEAHAVARGITGHLVGEADVAILDMEAGLEHLGRGTAENVDMLLIVVEPYYRALETATRIRDLAVQLDIPQISVVANRVRTDREREAVAQHCRAHDLELIAVIPYDETILDAEGRGVAPVDAVPDSPAVQAIENLVTLLLARL